MVVYHQRMVLERSISEGWDVRLSERWETGRNAKFAERCPKTPPSALIIRVSPPPETYHALWPLISVLLGVSPHLKNVASIMAWLQYIPRHGTSPRSFWGEKCTGTG